MSRNRPYTSRAASLEKAIGSLEGWAFGEWLKFTSIGYGSQLYISLKSGWVEVDGFRELPGLKEFADNLNAATKPVREAYAKRLRQELSNECIEIAASALSKPEPR